MQEAEYALYPSPLCSMEPPLWQCAPRHSDAGNDGNVCNALKIITSNSSVGMEAQTCQLHFVSLELVFFH